MSPSQRQGPFPGYPLFGSPPVLSLLKFVPSRAGSLFPLLTDILPSHPLPFKYTIKPRSEKAAALIASVEL